MKHDNRCTDNYCTPSCLRRQGQQSLFEGEQLDLIEAFEDSDLPAGHLRAFREGARYGYLKAKREVVGLIDLRLEGEARKVESAVADQELMTLRHYVRNVMLWFEGGAKR